VNEGEVILTPIAQADGQVKNRPAVVLRELPPYRDLLICGVSTQVQHLVPGFADGCLRLPQLSGIALAVAGHLW